MPLTLTPLDRTSRRLLARIDTALELGSGTPRESVALAWRSAVRDEPATRLLLTPPASSADAALHATRRSVLASVAVAAGLASFDTPAPVACSLGEALLRSVDAVDEPARPSWLARALRRLWDGGPSDPWPWAA
jgi:hypothetical protein